MDNLVNLFTNEHGQFQNNFKIQVILLFLFILVIFSKIWGANNIGIFVILAISFSLYISNIYVKVNTIQNIDLDDDNKQTFIKLNTLQSKVYTYIRNQIIQSTSNGLKLPKNDQIVLLNKNKLEYLYIDSTLIHFLYSILPLYDYNPDEFYLLLKGTNNILKLQKEIEDYYLSNKDNKQETLFIQKLPSFRTDPIPKIEPKFLENLSEMFEIAIQLKTKCINSLHNIIYSVPKTNKMYTYIDDVIQRYTILINRHLDVFQKYNNDSINFTGITNRTKFINYKHAKGYDRLENHSIIPNKEHANLIQFYV